MIDESIIRSQLNNCLMETDFPQLGDKYRGKVRDSYITPEKRFLIVSDRISSFDHILKEPIPFKGQVLNQIAQFNFKQVEDIVENHIIEVPDPNVTVAKEAKVYPVEFVVRGYLTGHSWRVYRDGGRELCGVPLPEGMRENQKFETPIITPTTKEEEGHDLEITREEIMKQGIVPTEVYKKMEEIALAVFAKGTEVAANHGLILVDTKYEFADYQGKLILVDEIHTPDSSRYFYKDTYQELFDADQPQRQLSKEFVREWLMDHNFRGRDGEIMPTLDDDFRVEVSQRYIELYEKLTGMEFKPDIEKPIVERITDNLTKYL